jgi:hypothetical protein
VLSDSCPSQRWLPSNTLLWIRISSGQLCVEVDNSKAEYVTDLPWERPGHPITGDPLMSDIDLDPANMCLDEIHCILSVPIGRRQLYFPDIQNPGAAPCTILLGSLSVPASNYLLGSVSVPASNYLHVLSQISVSDGLGLADLYAEGWELAGQDAYPLCPVMVQLPNGWTRYDCLLFNLCLV